MNILDAIEGGLGMTAYCVDSVIDVIMETAPPEKMGERIREYLANPTGFVIIGFKMYAEQPQYEKLKAILDEAGVLETPK